MCLCGELKCMEMVRSGELDETSSQNTLLALSAICRENYSAMQAF